VALSPRQLPEHSSVRTPSAGRPEEGPRLRAVVATARFWCFAAAFFFTPLSNFMVTTHQVAHIVEAGFDPRRAAAAFGAVGLLSAVGRVTFGALSDRWGRVPTALLSYAATAGGTLALLLLAPGMPGWLLWAYVLTFGLTLGARGPIVAALTADVYRGRSFGAVLGIITFGNRVGSAIGPWLGGVIYDLTGSYRLAFAVSIAALSVAAGAFAAAGRNEAKD
jgi:MFS family permease